MIRQKVLAPLWLFISKSSVECMTWTCCLHRCYAMFEYLFDGKNTEFCIQIKGSSANSPKRLTAHFAACDFRCAVRAKKNFSLFFFIAHLKFLSKWFLVRVRFSMKTNYRQSNEWWIGFLCTKVRFIRFLNRPLIGRENAEQKSTHTQHTF